MAIGSQPYMAPTGEMAQGQSAPAPAPQAPQPPPATSPGGPTPTQPPQMDVMNKMRAQWVNPLRSNSFSRGKPNPMMNMAGYRSRAAQGMALQRKQGPNAQLKTAYQNFLGSQGQGKAKGFQAPPQRALGRRASGRYRKKNPWATSPGAPMPPPQGPTPTPKPLSPQPGPTPTVDMRNPAPTPPPDRQPLPVQPGPTDMYQRWYQQQG